MTQAQLALAHFVLKLGLHLFIIIAETNYGSFAMEHCPIIYNHCTSQSGRFRVNLAQNQPKIINKTSPLNVQ